MFLVNRTINNEVMIHNINPFSGKIIKSSICPNLGNERIFFGTSDQTLLLELIFLK